MAKKVFISTYEPILLNDGTVNAGGSLYWYKVGTSTAKDTYTSTSLATANANPVVLDSAGRATVVLNGDYKLVIKDSSGNTIKTIENVNPDILESTHVDYNVIDNGSFEIDDDSDGEPDYWTSTVFSGGTFLLDTDIAAHGTKSAKFASTGSGGGYITSSNFYPCSPNEDINWSFEIKATNGSSRNIATILFYQIDESASAGGDSTLYDKSADNPADFTAYSGSISVPSDARLFKVRLTGVDSTVAVSGSTWFDNVRIGTTPQVEIDIGLTLGVTGGASFL